MQQNSLFATDVSTFEAAIAKLPERDQDFATSLASQWRRKGLSEKQRACVARLTERANGTEPPREQIGDMSGIMTLFDTARSKLKHPKIVLSWGDAGRARNMRLSIAGERARVPGSVNVTDHENGDWYGRIHVDGRFEASQRVETPYELVDELREFAARPAEAAAEHAGIMGCCCFCNTPIKDARSLGVGYGPTCAKNWGLPWGRAAANAGDDLLKHLVEADKLGAEAVNKLTPGYVFVGARPEAEAAGCAEKPERGVFVSAYLSELDKRGGVVTDDDGAFLRFREAGTR